VGSVSYRKEYGLRMAAKDDLKACFSRVVEESMDALYGMALRLTRNDAAAEDLVADSVAAAWVAFGKLENRKSARPWLFRILYNRFVSDYRRKSARPVETSWVELDASCDDQDDMFNLLESLPHEFQVWWSNPERDYVNKLLGEDIANAIASLPEVFRTAVVLVNVEGLTYDEAANVLGVPPGTIRSRMRRGRTLLQKSLWEHAKDAGLETADQRGDVA
jgi:RNA polymerase sigma-70 factor (ECF subfamily)